MLKVLNQEETPLLYSLVFGEGVVNDATSIVLFNAVQSLDFSNFNTVMALKLFGTFVYLFCTSTALGVTVSLKCYQSFNFFTCRNNIIVHELASFTKKSLIQLSSFNQIFVLEFDANLTGTRT